MKLKWLYDAIENGVVDVSNLSLKDRIAELTPTRDKARGDSERAVAHIVKIGPAITPPVPSRFLGRPRQKAAERRRHNRPRSSARSHTAL